MPDPVPVNVSKAVCLSHVLCVYILISGNIIHAQIFISINEGPFCLLSNSEGHSI